MDKERKPEPQPTPQPRPEPAPPVYRRAAESDILPTDMVPAAVPERELGLYDRERSPWPHA